MRISKWDIYYENAQSRKVHHLSWVPVPNKHDGETYSELMARDDAHEIFTAWILMLQVASRSQCRGSLLRDNGTTHTPESLSVKTRGKVEWFKKAIPYLLQVGWLEQLTIDAPSTLIAHYQSAGIEQKEQKEQNSTEGIAFEERYEIPEKLRTEAFIVIWDSWMKCRNPSNSQSHKTKVMFREQLLMLSKLSSDVAIDSVRNSIRNGWNGIFHPKEKPLSKIIKVPTALEAMGGVD